MPEPQENWPETIRPIPVEDVSTREAEWDDIMPGYGQAPTMRTYKYDRVHGDIEVDGPVIEINPPERPA